MTLPFSYKQRCKVETELFRCIDSTINNFNYDSNFHYFLAHIKRAKNLIYNNVVADWPIGSFKSNNIIIKFYKLFILVIYHISILSSLIIGFVNIILRIVNSKI